MTMKKIIFSGFALLCLVSIGNAQSTFYNVTAGNGNGLRFWNSDQFKIHMGNTSEYKFGPVTDYSIKSNMSTEAGRGWTWGAGGAVPIAGLSNTGNFTIAGAFNSSSLSVNNNATGDWGYALSINVNRDLTKAFTVNSTTGGTLFAIWGNGIVNTKKIYAEEIAVQANTSNIFWPDYVFKSDYKLNSLAHVENFIAKNHHLPDVPSEAEIKSCGINVGEMNAILLRKIEELTLYTIQLEKRSAALEKSVIELQNSKN